MAENSVLLGQLAEEFTARVRAGKLPQIEEYARQHPALGERIRALFPTLLFLEGMAAGKPADGSAAATVAPGGGPADFAAGQTFNQYRIERQLGRGGMGVVYEAVHLPLSKRVALKVLPILAGSSASHLERFLREAQTAAGLHHTNIVPVFDIGQSNNMPYYAMQYIEGRGLDRVLAESPAEFGPPHSAGFFRRVGQLGIQAADALAYAHERGVIHRDIKPSNLLLDKQGVLWITDFGLARRQQDVALTHSGALVGTPRYMSPEQAEASRCPIDHRTDVYSLGVTLYELVTSRPPFSGKTPAEVVLQIIGREPIPPRRLDPAIPRDLETIILKAMAKQPRDRYQTAAELGDDLRRWLNLEPIKARRIGPAGRTIRWCRRNPRLALVSAAAAMIILALSSIYYVNASNARREAEAQRDNARTAVDQAKDTLARSLYDQARLLLSSRQPGRRWLALDHLKEAEKLRSRARANPAGKPPADLPSRTELRDVAVAALLLGDARVVSRIETGVNGPTFTGDGRRAAVLWIDYILDKTSIRVLDLQDGKVQSQCDVPSPTAALAMRPDGKVLAVASDDPPSITLLECSTGKTLSTIAVPASVKGKQPVPPAGQDASQPGPSEQGENVAKPLGAPWIFRPSLAVHLMFKSASGAPCTYSPDGGYLAVQREVLVLHDVRDPAHPKTLVAAPGFFSSGNWQFVPAYAFNSRGNVLAYLSGEQVISLWEFQSGNKPREIALPLPISGPVAFGDNDQLLVAVSPGPKKLAGSKVQLLIWDLSRNCEKARVELEENPAVVSLALSPDGKRLALGTLTLPATIQLYDVSTGKKLMRIESADRLAVTSLQWQKDGKHLVSAGWDGVTKVWELIEQGIQTWADAIPLATSGDGKWIVDSESNKIRLINRATRKVAHEWNSPESPQKVLFRPDGRQLAVLYPGLVLAWDLGSGKEVIHWECKDVEWSSWAFDAEGRLLALRTQNQRLGVWDAAAAKPLWQAPDTDARQGFLSSDGRCLMEWQYGGPQVKASGPILIRELPKGRIVSELPRPEGSGLIQEGLFSPNGLWVAAWRHGARWREARLWLWKLPSSERRALASVRSSILKHSFSPDSKLLATVNNDSGAVEFWDVEKGERLFTWAAEEWRGLGHDLYSLTFTPDGSSLMCEAATMGGDEVQPQMLNLARLRSQLAELGLDW
jgi:WD40 repeat protein